MSPSLRTPPAGVVRGRRARLAASCVAALGLAGLLAACGDAGSSGTQPGATRTQGATVAAATCEPVAGDQLVVLTDDKKLQTVDNVVPALNAKAVAGDAGLVPLLDSVSQALTTDELITMNKSVDVERKKSADVAQQFVADKSLAASDASAGAGTKITIGAANFSENQTLANIYGDVLKSAGYSVTVKTIGNRELYLKQLENGSLTLVPEYAGTLTEFLNKAANGPDASPLASGDLDETVAHLADLGKDAGLAFGTPSPAADQNAFAVTTAFAQKYGVSTLSELAAACGNLVLGGPPECTTRPFCQPGLEQTYGLTFKQFVSLDAGGPLTKTALEKGRVALGLVFSSDGQLGASGGGTATS